MPSTKEIIRDIQHKLNNMEGRINTGGGGGVGNHNILSAVHPDSVIGAAVAGDLIYANATPKWTRRPIGAAGTYIRSDGAAPVYSAIQAGDLPAHAASHLGGGGDQVDHDLLLNFVADEHLDHTTISISGGTGLAGGGTIAANRTITLSHLGLETLADPGADRIMFWDDSESALKWMEGSEGIQFNLTNILLNINGLGEDAGAKSGDFFVYWDTDDAIHYKLDYDDLPGGGGASPWTVDVNDIYWDGTGHVTIGAIAPDSKMNNVGFNIYTPASADQLHFVIQNADVAHGFTAYADADTYFAIQKNNDPAGGAWIGGFSDATTPGIKMWGLANAASTSSTTAAEALLVFAAAERSGSGGVKAGDSDNCFAWINWTTTIMILKGRGDLIFPDTQCRIFLGDSINTFMYSGITINQKDYDNEILTFKASDVNHGITTPTEYDTYGFFKKVLAGIGGIQMCGLSEITIGIEIKGGGDTDNTTKGAAGIAPIILNAIKKSGTTFGAVGANGNLVAIRNNDGSVWITDAEGDVWQNGVLHIPNMKSGANQAAAGAAAGELWHDTDDNTVKMGI